MTIPDSPASKSKSPAFGSSDRLANAWMPAIARGHPCVGTSDDFAGQLTVRVLPVWGWPQAGQAPDCLWAVHYCHAPEPPDVGPPHSVPEVRRRHSDGTRPHWARPGWRPWAVRGGQA